tara:strand:+ start:698 stop:991 length:294 start_codon:yes stop_codon:yes gene_type:complete
MKRYKKEIVNAIIGFIVGILFFYLTNQIYEVWGMGYIPFLLMLSPILVSAFILYFAVIEGVSKKLTIAAGIATALNCCILFVLWWMISPWRSGLFGN